MCSAPTSSAVCSRAALMSTATTDAPVMRAYWTARWPRPPAPKTATRLDDVAPGDLDRLVRGHAGAGQRRGVRGVDAVRHPHDVARVADRVLGEPAVERVARVDLLLGRASRARCCSSGTRRRRSRARAARRACPARGRASFPAPRRSIDADALVAGDERRRRLDRPLAAGGVDVGVAEPARLDPDEHLFGAGLGDRQILDLERLIEAADDGGFHGTTSDFQPA